MLITTHVGQRFFVELPGFDFEMYEWLLTPSSSSIISDGAFEFGKPPDPHKTGAWVSHRFPFVAKEPGTFAITAEAKPTTGNMQPDPSGATAETQTITVKVEA